MSVFTSNAYSDDNDLSIYPVPVNIRDFNYSEQPIHSPEASVPKMVDFAHTMGKYYPDRGDQDSIFIAMASYRDDECVKTIMNAFETAMYPDRLRFGVFQQHNVTDGDCADFDKLINCDHRYGVIHPLCGRFWQIQVDRIHFKDAKGPMYGRYRAELFYAEETFALQIDAHTRFVPLWDNILVDMFERIGNDNAVLTTYPKGTNEKVEGWMAPISRPSRSVVAICQSKITRSYMFKHERGRFVRNPSRPVLAPFFAAGFCFAKGHKVVNVPSDPYLPYLFDGEEILMTTRLWTNGYDIYMPDRDIIFHIYEEHRKRPLFWHDEWGKEKIKYEHKAQNRVLHLLGLLEKFKPEVLRTSFEFNRSVDLREIDVYGMGNERDIREYWEWILMDFDAKEKISADFCKSKQIQEGKLKRIPTKTMD